MTDETMSIGILAERVDHLSCLVAEVRKDVKSMIWKVAALAGALGGAAGYFGGKFGV